MKSSSNHKEVDVGMSPCISHHPYYIVAVLVLVDFDYCHILYLLYLYSV